MCCKGGLLAGVLLLGLGLPVARAGEKPPVPAAPQREAVATVTRVSGVAEFRLAYETAFKALAADKSLSKGDEVRTGKKSGLELKLSDDSRVTLGEESSLVLREVRGKFKSDRTLLDLDEGALGVAVEKLGERQRFEVSTPVAVCGVRGTRWSVEHAEPRGGRTNKDRGTSMVTVGSGRVVVSCVNPALAGQTQELGKGQSLVITWEGFGKLGNVDLPGWKSLTKSLPGWQPDPADPNLTGLLRPLPGGRREVPGGGWWNRGVSAGDGAYDQGSRGFSNAVEGAILGRLCGVGAPGRGQQGGGEGGSGSPGGAGSPTAPDGLLFSPDPVLDVLVRPGQPTQPPQPPIKPPVD